MDRKHAERLYRAQNVIWLWLGLSALLSALQFYVRPSLGATVVTPYPVLDDTRTAFFAVGGVGISAGIWWVRRVLEVWGHCLFASGAVMTGIAEWTLNLGVLPVVTTFGVALASALRVWYIVAWIGAGRITAVVQQEHDALSSE